MSEELVSRVEQYTFHREYEPRQVIYFPDDACDHVFWVRKGRVKVTRVSDDGRELALRHVLPGDMLGEEHLVGQSRRGALAEAMEPTILCHMRSDDFRRLAEEDPEVALELAKRLCRRVVETEQVLSEIVFKPVRSRVAAALSRLHQRAPEGEKDKLRLTHQEIANLVGSTRETTTNVLHALRKEGMLDISNRQLTVLDPVALEHAAGGH